MKRLLRCPRCAAYTLQETHSCGALSVPPQPAKWSPEDRYGKYRRDARREELVGKGLL